MVTDRQFRRLRKLLQTETTLVKAADKAGVDEKTARKYRDSDRLPTERRAPHTWRTREGRSISSPSLASFRNVTVDQ
jgi:hypothetical protein